MLDGMVDLETLSTAPNSVILTLGAVKFDPRTKEEPLDPLYIRVSIEQQTEELGRDISESTLSFWAQQDKSVMEEALSDAGRVSMKEMLDQFHKWAWHTNCIWSNGSIFDIMILENVYAQLKRVPAWNFWDVRDVRTMFDLGIDPMMDKSNLHNALADAYQQAKGIQHVYSELGINK